MLILCPEHHHQLCHQMSSASPGILCKSRYIITIMMIIIIMYMYTCLDWTNFEHFSTWALNKYKDIYLPVTLKCPQEFVSATFHSCGGITDETWQYKPCTDVFLCEEHDRANLSGISKGLQYWGACSIKPRTSVITPLTHQAVLKIFLEQN